MALRAQQPTLSVHTVEGVQVDGEAIGLPEALATIPADIWLVAGMGPHVAGQLNGLGKHSIAVLAGIHFPWKYIWLIRAGHSIYGIHTNKRKFYGIHQETITCFMTWKPQVNCNTLDK